MASEFTMPKLGHLMEQGIVVRWWKEAGEHVVKDEVLLEIETDKATLEVESPFDGTLLEVLVVPYRAGHRQLAEQYEALLTRSRGVRLVDVSREQLRAAAQLRAATGVKTPDALQIAAALTTGCSTLVTNDRRLPEVPGLRVIQLSSYLR